MSPASDLPNVMSGSPNAIVTQKELAMQTMKISPEIDRTPSRGATQTRYTALAGIIGPVLFSAVFLAQQAFRQAAYDPIAEPVSALEAGRYGWIQQANFVVFGLFMLAFTVGLHRGIDRSQRGILGPALLGAASTGLFIAAAIPLREDAAGEVYDPGGHFVAGVTFFLGTALAMLVLSRRLAKDPYFRSLATYTAICGVLALIGFVVMGRFAVPDGAPLHEVAGALQRVVLLVVTFPCLVLLALRLRSKGQ